MIVAATVMSTGRIAMRHANGNCVSRSGLERGAVTRE
jgi:hypothetical protein